MTRSWTCFKLRWQLSPSGNPSLFVATFYAEQLARIRSRELVIGR
jgi:hypothetical protein